jgi:hypothetical protein
MNIMFLGMLKQLQSCSARELPRDETAAELPRGQLMLTLRVA